MFLAVEQRDHDARPFSHPGERPRWWRGGLPVRPTSRSPRSSGGREDCGGAGPCGLVRPEATESPHGGRPNLCLKALPGSRFPGAGVPLLRRLLGGLLGGGPAGSWRAGFLAGGLLGARASVAAGFLAGASWAGGFLGASPSWRADFLGRGLLGGPVLAGCLIGGRLHVAGFLGRGLDRGLRGGAAAGFLAAGALARWALAEAFRLLDRAAGIWPSLGSLAGALLAGALTGSAFFAGPGPGLAPTGAAVVPPPSCARPGTFGNAPCRRRAAGGPWRSRGAPPCRWP